MALCVAVIDLSSESEVSISTHYTAVRINEKHLSKQSSHYEKYG